MIQDLKKIWRIFTPEERRKVVWMLMLLVLMAGVETVSVLSIMPFLSVLARPAIIHENMFLQGVYDRFGFADARAFITALGLATATLVIASSLFKMVTQHIMNRFIHLERHAISSRLLTRYLGQPYEFFLTRNSAALNKNI